VCSRCDALDGCVGGTKRTSVAEQRLENWKLEAGTCFEKVHFRNPEIHLSGTRGHESLSPTMLRLPVGCHTVQLSAVG